jgi:hypothetical protein
MPKQRLIEMSVFNRLLNLFLKAKSNNREQSFIRDISKKDPQLGKLYSIWNDRMDDALISMKNTLQKQGLSTKEIDKILNKNY